MIERLAGAVVAIAAAALLVAGVVTSAWWVGATTETSRGGARDRHIGLRSEEQCFITHEASGKPRCTATTTTDCDSSASHSCQTAGTIKHNTLFGVAGWGASGFGMLATLLLAIAAGAALTRGGESSRGAASGALVLSALAGACGAAFIVLRPALPDLEGAIGWSAWSFLGGAGGGVLAGLILRREPRARPVVHAHAPSGPVAAPRGMEFDVGALFSDDETSQKASLAAFTRDEPTDADRAPPPAMIAARVPPRVPEPSAARVPSENRADTEKDLPPDDMQGTPAPVAAAPPPPAVSPPPPPAPPPPPPARAKPPSLPPLPLPRTKPPSLPPPFKPPAIPTGTGASPRIAPSETKPPPPAPAAAAPNPAGPVPACPQCDAPTVWNEEHLRFFCRKCRIYL